MSNKTPVDISLLSRRKPQFQKSYFESAIKPLLVLEQQSGKNPKELAGKGSFRNMSSVITDGDRTAEMGSSYNKRITQMLDSAQKSHKKRFTSRAPRNYQVLDQPKLPKTTKAGQSLSPYKVMKKYVESSVLSMPSRDFLFTDQ